MRPSGGTAAMNDHDTNNLKHVILYHVQREGIEAAKQKYLACLDPTDAKLRQMRRLFAQLREDENGEWFFDESQL